jgi:hypothetical protein
MIVLLGRVIPSFHSHSHCHYHFHMDWVCLPYQTALERDEMRNHKTKDPRLVDRLNRIHMDMAVVAVAGGDHS